MSLKTSGNMYFCNNCDSFVKFFKELWCKKLDGPYKIELFQYEHKTAIKVGEIKLRKKPEGIISSYAYCGNCNQPLGIPIDTDFLIAMENFNPLTSKN